jgi:hypothetical protein
MPDNVSDDAPMVESRTLYNLPNSEKPTIKVLLYTDDPLFIVKEPGPPFGLGLMINHLLGHPPAFANLSITWQSRYVGATSTANNKINVALEREEAKNEPFDQVWFFSLHQVNKQTFSLGVGGGGPESELDQAEFSALERRMDAGLGILVTGDHANRRPLDALPLAQNAPCPDPLRDKPFLGLGRALGRCIPRAGELRDWENKPTANPLHSFNTQVVIFGRDVETEIGFQQDATPQQLILQSFNAKGRPSLSGQPHPLFFYRLGQAIQLYPDHLHEGAVVIPEQFNEPRWPSKNGCQPKPRVIAYGLDKRNGTKLKLIAAYDGDSVSAGRIVADSTWHHYFNVNLESFKHPGLPFSPADQIGQYYRNLALWLTPSQKRKEMRDVMARWLARQPAIAELVGPQPSKRLSDMMRTGAVARKFLAEVASTCEIHELCQTLVPDSRRQGYETFYFPDQGFALSPLPSKELLLGSLVHGVTRQSTQTIALNISTDAERAAGQSAIAAAAELAFTRQRLRVERTARSIQRFFGDTEPISTLAEAKTESNSETNPNNRLSSERSVIMAACDNRPWDITLVLDRDPTIVERLFFRNVRIDNGVIRGDVEKPVGTKISDLIGTCGPFVQGSAPNLSSMTFVFRLRDANREVAICLPGVAFVRAANNPVEFMGKFFAFPPGADTPNAVQANNLLIPGDGDTGTGTGTQT